MIISHDPLFNVDKLEDLYSKQDDVPVRYVCTSELKLSNAPMDIFFRETPHPKFGNHYFGIFNREGENYITNADAVEDYDFAMVEGKAGLVYSSYRHNCRIVETIDGRQNMIDGGRAYVRSMGPTRLFVVRNGSFQEVSVDTTNVEKL
jgi:hypothetical protein